METNGEKVAKITFPDGRNCYLKIFKNAAIGMTLHSDYCYYDKDCKAKACKVEDIKCGKGITTVEYPNGSIYKGFIEKFDRDGNITGEGEFINNHAFRSVYKGIFLGGKLLIGKGRCASEFDNEEYREYSYEYGKGLSNNVTIQYKNGDCYTGEVGKDGRLNGKGMYIKANSGGIFTGDFKDGKFWEGKCKYSIKAWSNERNRECEYKEGKPTLTRIFYKNGTIYEGGVDEKELPHGKGKFTTLVNEKGKYVEKTIECEYAHGQVIPNKLDRRTKLEIKNSSSSRQVF